jgi:hypothetical protein
MPATERTRGRPSVGIITPSLTRHVVIFFPARAPFDKADDDPLSSDSTKTLLSDYVLSLLKIAADSGALARSQCDIELKKFKAAANARSSFAVYCGTFLGLRLRVIVVLYAEHIGLTYILDNAAVTGGSPPFPSPTTKNVIELAAYLHDRLTGASQIAKPPHEIAVSSAYKPIELKRTDNDVLNDIIYRQVWIALDLTLDNNSYITRLGMAVFKNELRGLSLTATPIDKEPDADIYAKIQCGEAVAPPSSEGAWQRPRITRYLKEHSSFFSATLTLATSHHLYAGNQPAAQWDPNYVLCFLNDETAIYGSCLVYRDDPHSSEIEDFYQKNYNYTRFFIIYDGTNVYTLGRLIRRIHVLTELRVMALIERSHITGLNDCLRLLGRELSSVIDRMTGRHGAQTREEPETLDVDTLSRIIDAYNDLGVSRVAEDAERSRSILIDSKRIAFDRCYGGLTYRISRSKFYYKALLSRLDDLHCKDMKGAQSYTRFVSRNYTQQMQAIESIGERYDILGARIDRAITISHNLLQRKFAQYALFVALCVAAVPSFIAANSTIMLIFDPAMKCTLRLGSTELITITRPMLSLGALALIIAGVGTLAIIFRRYLKKRGLYVRIKKPNGMNWMERIFGALRAA